MRHTAIGCVSLLLASAAAAEVTLEALPLWPGTPPGSERFESEAVYDQRGTIDRSDRWLTGVAVPELTVYRPPADRATGAAVAVFPGGGYRGQAIDKEGHYVARWLADRGVVGVVVPYRCGGAPHLHPAPMNDAQRTVQRIRANATRWGLDPQRVGVMGFSAGGHLAATAATQWIEADPDADDVVLRHGSRPDFAVLVYPVISLRREISHGGSLTALLGDSPTDAQIAALSADERVTDRTPPTLLIHSIDDAVVPVENPQRFYDACRAAGVPVEMHLYETGGHGFDMWASDGSIAGWPDVLEGWLAARGLAKPAD